MKAKHSRRQILKLSIAGALAAPFATGSALAQSSQEFPAELKLDWGFYLTHAADKEQGLA